MNCHCDECTCGKRDEPEPMMDILARAKQHGAVIGSTGDTATFNRQELAAFAESIRAGAIAEWDKSSALRRAIDFDAAMAKGRAESASRIAELERKLDEQGKIFNAVLNPRGKSIEGFAAKLAEAERRGYQQGKVEGYAYGRDSLQLEYSQRKPVAYEWQMRGELQVTATKPNTGFIGLMRIPPAPATKPISGTSSVSIKLNREWLVEPATKKEEVRK